MLIFLNLLYFSFLFYLKRNINNQQKNLTHYWFYSTTLAIFEGKISITLRVHFHPSIWPKYYIINTIKGHHDFLQSAVVLCGLQRLTKHCPLMCSMHKDMNKDNVSIFSYGALFSCWQTVTPNCQQILYVSEMKTNTHHRNLSIAAKFGHVVSQITGYKQWMIAVLGHDSAL